jgi:hypothetical protein
VDWLFIERAQEIIEDQGKTMIGWSAADGRSWDGYRQRLGHHGARLDAFLTPVRRRART